MKTKEILWKKGLVIICQKCGISINKTSVDSIGGNIAENLKNYFRKKLAEENIISAPRVIPGGCLNICESGRQVIAYMPVGPTIEKSEIITCDPEKDRDAVYQWIKSK